MVELCQAKSRAEAWLQAAGRLLEAPDLELYNLIVEIEKPCVINPKDKEIEDWLNQHLKQKKLYTINTVAETIFPASEYKRYQEDGVFNVYPDRVFPTLRKWGANNRGTYAMRILRGINSKGEKTRPLENVIDQLKKQTAPNGRGIRMCYEIALSQPCDISISQNDRNVKAFPCLSHLSFKLSKDRKVVHLTALYRSQYYFEKALGNFLGLARLLSFVAKQVGLEPGSIVCHATYAKLDVRKTVKDELQELLNGKEVA